jgi:hypothetical protein
MELEEVSRYGFSHTPRQTLQNVNTHTREQAARQRTDTSVEADEERHRCR